MILGSFLEIFDSTDLQPICDSLEKTSGIPCAIIDKDNVIICSSQPAGQYFKITCQAGLLEMYIPILVHQDIVGNLYLGPYFLGQPVPEVILGLSAGLDPQELTILQSIPVISETSLDTTLSVAQTMIDLLSEIGHTRIALHQHDANGKPNLKDSNPSNSDKDKSGDDFIFYSKNKSLTLPTDSLPGRRNPYTTSTRSENNDSRNREIAFLTNLSYQLSTLPSTEDLEAFLLREIRQFANPVITGYSDYKPETRELALELIEINQKIFERIMKVFPREILHTVATITDKDLQQFISEIVTSRKTFVEVSFGSISRFTDKILRTITGVNILYGISLVVEGEFIGALLLCFRSDQDVPSEELMESFANMAAVALRKKKADDALKISESRYRGLFEANRDSISIFFVNPDSTLGNFIEMNEAALQMMGYTREEFLQLSGPDIEVESSPQVLMERQRTLMEKNYVSTETLIRHKSGKIFPVELVIIPIHYDNRIAIMNIVRDISERKKTEAELIDAKEKAQESDRLKSAFLTNLSHEIRTPMNAILGFAGLLEDEELNIEDRYNYTSIIKSNGNHLLTIINDIIDVSKLDSHQLILSKTHFNLNLMLDQLFQVIEKQLQNFRKEHIGFQLHKVFQDQQSIIFTDEMRLKQILLNLLENAVKFTSQGSIHFGYIQIKDRLEFFVKDSGKGISTAKQSVVFDRFRQENETYTRQYGGTGLGLTICKGLVELMSGEIWFVSEEGQGSTFFFNLPYQAPVSLLSVEDPWYPETIEINLKGRKVLIAEDVYENYELVNIYLQSTNADVLYAENGEVAWQLFQENPDIELILMDIQMPVMNGYDTISLIRTQNTNIPIFALTAYNNVEDRKKSLTAGCNEVLIKPIEKGNLISLISKHLHVT